MEPTIFTRIINGEIPSHKVYEDELTYAFLDIYPLQPGHTLVVPKRQVEFVWDLDAVDYHAVMATAQKVAQRLREVLGAPYISSQVIGVDVPHAHVHLIPFTEAAQLRQKQDMTTEPDHIALAELAKRVAF